MKKIAIAYIPVLHDGYRKFVEENKTADAVYILGTELIAQFDYLAKEIRQLDPALVKLAIDSWKVGVNVSMLTEVEIEKIQKSKPAIVFSGEDVSRQLAEKYFSGLNVSYTKIFLRWDKHNTVKLEPVTSDKKISANEFDKKMIELALDEATKASDFWRHVGAIVVKDGNIIGKRHNEHVPSEHTPYANGDPRNAFKKGVNLELSTVLHAEAGLVADAARTGTSLEGAEIYVSTFPCPPCAKQIAYAGIKKLYYLQGYGVLDAESILRSRGVEIIYVDLGKDGESLGEWRGYKKD